MVYLTCAIIGLGGRGEIIHGLRGSQQRLYIQSHLSGSSIIQPLAAREEIGTIVSPFSFLIIKT